MDKQKDPPKTIVEAAESDGAKTPAVLAYRVGQLEKRQEMGFNQLALQNTTLLDKIDSLAHNFATKGDLNTLNLQAKTEHKHIEDKIEDVDEQLGARLAKVENWLTWAGRIVLGAVILAVIGAVISSH